MELILDISVVFFIQGCKAIYYNSSRRAVLQDWVHAAVPVLSVEQTEAQTLPPVVFRANRISADGHLLRCVRQSTGRSGNSLPAPRPEG